MPQQQHKEEHHGWNGLESRQYANYALPEASRREENLRQEFQQNHQQNLNRLLFMLMQPNQLVPLVNYPNNKYDENMQRRQDTNDEVSKEERINRIFEKHIKSIEKDIARS